jgi:hypothetical protein
MMSNFGIITGGKKLEPVSIGPEAPKNIYYNEFLIFPYCRRSSKFIFTASLVLIHQFLVFQPVDIT